MDKYCKHCNWFKPTLVTKLSWLRRKELAKEKHPELSGMECSALANHNELWEKEETEYGICNYHEFEDSIPNYMSCKMFEKRL